MVKKCKICKSTNMNSFSSLQSTCSIKCAIKLTRINEEKKFNKKTKELRRGIRTKSEWLKLAQKEFNRYIRIRDRNEPCISCGVKNPNIQYAAGHYLTVGGHPELRFDEKNCHKQCNKKCNMMLSGNLAKYRVNLIKRIGQDGVEYLEGIHKSKNYTIDDIIKIRDKYRNIANNLGKQLKYS